MSGNQLAQGVIKWRLAFSSRHGCDVLHFVPVNPSKGSQQTIEVLKSTHYYNTSPWKTGLRCFFHDLVVLDGVVSEVSN